MKSNSIQIALLLISTSFILFLLYMNSALTHQIEERDNIIVKMQKENTIIDSLIISKQTDTTSVITFLRDDHGKIITYQELDSLYQFYKREDYIKDVIIRNAKQKYHFDYRITQHGDTLLFSIWDKKYTVQSNQLEFDIE